MNRILRIKLIANPKKEWALKLSKKVAQLLKRNGYAISDKSAEITVCIGGDGTILHANHEKKISGAVLAIGSDSSHICQVNRKEWRKILNLIKTKKTERHILLKTKIGGKKYNAINDVVVHTHDYRVVEIEVNVINSGSKYLSKSHWFEGDGIIVSTPLGSSGYAYSAGGEIINPAGKKLIQTVPICAYKRRFKPHLINVKSEVLISADRTADFIIDGIYIKRLKPGEKVFVKAEGFVDFLR